MALRDHKPLKSHFFPSSPHGWQSVIVASIQVSVYLGKCTFEFLDINLTCVETDEFVLFYKEAQVNLNI